MLSKAGGPLVVVGMTVLLLAFGNESASAQQRSFLDPAHDVVLTAKATPLAHRREGDVRRAVVRYGPHRIGVVMHFRELRPDHRFEIGGNFKNPETGFSPLLAVWRPKHPHRPSVGVGGDESYRCTQPRGDKQRHETIRTRTNYTANTIYISFWRGCIGSPDWIRANLVAVARSGPRKQGSDWVSYPTKGSFSRRLYAG
ncbi:MAG: hypothetical protein QOK15_828 [Nocardioidaceae bacterium]|jgi:hypothetical protein|nr:hypothetical protein [Nocardioidaceae bacterium]